MVDDDQFTPDQQLYLSDFKTGETVFKLRRTKIKQGKNNPIYSNKNHFAALHSSLFSRKKKSLARLCVYKTAYCFFFNIGETFAFFQSFGVCPWSMDAWKILVIESVTLSGILWRSHLDQSHFKVKSLQELQYALLGDSDIRNRWDSTSTKRRDVGCIFYSEHWWELLVQERSFCLQVSM